MFKPESLTQTVVPGQVGTAVWQNGLRFPDDFLKDSFKDKNTQQALCLEKSHSSSPNARIKDKKTFSPTANGAQPPVFQNTHHHQRRRPRPPSYHRVSAGRRGETVPVDEVYFDRRSRTFARYSRKGRVPSEAMYYSYYSDEDSASYYYIDQALPYEQWKELLLRQGSLCEISTTPSLAYATEWLV